MVDAGEVIDDICLRHRLGTGGDSLRIVTRSGKDRSGALCTCSNLGRKPPLADKSRWRVNGRVSREGEVGVCRW